MGATHSDRNDDGLVEVGLPNLHAACYSGDVQQVVSELSRVSAAGQKKAARLLLRSRDFRGWAPLHVAACRGRGVVTRLMGDFGLAADRAEICRILLRAGADRKLLTEPADGTAVSVLAVSLTL